MWCLHGRSVRRKNRRTVPRKLWGCSCDQCMLLTYADGNEVYTSENDGKLRRNSDILPNLEFAIKF